MNLNKTIYFVDPLFRALSSAVLHSQLFMQMKVLADLGCECHFFGADRPDEISDVKIEMLKRKYQISNLTVVPVPCLGASYKQVNPAIDNTLIKLLPELVKKQPDFMYTWHLPVWKAMNAISKTMRGTLIYQCQGALSREVRDRGGVSNFIKSLYWQHQERKIFPKVERMIAVSHGMNTWLQNSSGRSADFIVPCCFDEHVFFANSANKAIIRRDLGWAENVPVVVYSGGTSHWQRLDEMFPLIASVQKKISDLHVLILSCDSDNIKEMAIKAGINMSKAEVRSVPHEHVPNWLSAADVGIVMRHNSILNNVASPIKIAEYMACGLAVVCTDGIGDYSLLIKENDAGIVFSKNNAFELLVDFFNNTERIKNCQKNALRISREFSWESCAGTLKQIYQI